MLLQRTVWWRLRVLIQGNLGHNGRFVGDLEVGQKWVLRTLASNRATILTRHRRPPVAKDQEIFRQVPCALCGDSGKCAYCNRSLRIQLRASSLDFCHCWQRRRIPAANSGSERGQRLRSLRSPGMSRASGTKLCALSCTSALAGQEYGLRSRTPLVIIHW